MTKPTPEEKKEAVVKCAIYWKKVYSFEIEPKPGKDYELKYRTLLERATDSLFKAVEEL